jgi:putative ABC transport system substrate-binding protein
LQVKHYIVLWSLSLATGLFWFAPAAESAPPPPPLVAVILPRDNARFQTIHTAFLERFNKITTISGKPRLYIQSPNSDLMSLRNSIRKANALGADLVVVYGTRAAMAAKQEDFTEPLIFADVFEPVAMGLVPSLNRGGNLITGVSGYAPVQTLLKTLQETIGTGHLGVPVEPKNPAGKIQVDILTKAACRRAGTADDTNRLKQAGDLCWLEVLPTDMQTPSSAVKGLKTAVGKINSIYLSDLLPSDQHTAEILDYAAQAGLPVISQLPGTADLGAFATLESDPEEQGQLLGEIASKLIDGELPEDIPLVLPRKIALVVNLNIAKKLEIQVPFSVLSQTTRVVR